MTSRFLRTFLPAKRICTISLLAGIAASLVLTPTQLFAACNTEQQGGERKAKRFVIRKDEVHDRTTGLIWKRCAVGWYEYLTGRCDGFDQKTNSLLSWEQAQQIAKKAGPSWRLPTKVELEGLVSANCHNPSIDESMFPDTQIEWFWTSTAVDNGGIWQVFFGDGHSDHFDREASPSALRLVRKTP